MKIVYQGKEMETATTTVGGFLASIGVAVDKVIVEYKGDILSAEAAASAPVGVRVMIAAAHQANAVCALLLEEEL